jgi:hypothetical protein
MEGYKSSISRGSEPKSCITNQIKALSNNQVPLAQWIARRTSNPEVPGSTPGWDGTLLLLVFFQEAMILGYVVWEGLLYREKKPTKSLSAQDF